MVDRIKTDVDRLLLVPKMKKMFNFTKYISKPFFSIKTKSNLSTSVFIFSTIFQILETKFYVFLDTNIWKLDQILHMKLLIFSSITFP